VSKLAAFRNG